MKFVFAPLHGACIIEPEPAADERGYFARGFCAREFADHGLASNFVQANISFNSHAGTLRGMHYQIAPAAEVKLVRCVRGALFDALVDLRQESPTFLQWFGDTLTAENRKMMYVPEGFAHGLLALEPNTEAFYMVSQFYAPEMERGLRWDDPAIGIEWPRQPSVISERDRRHPDFNPGYHLGRS